MDRIIGYQYEKVVKAWKIQILGSREGFKVNTFMMSYINDCKRIPY